MDKDKEMLNEQNLSWAGKLFFASLAANIANDSNAHFPMKIKGTPEEIRAMAEAIYWSKEFKKELQQPGASVESIYKKLRMQNISREKFEQITGFKIPV